MFGKEVKDAEEQAAEKRSAMLKLARGQAGSGFSQTALTAAIYLELAAIHDLLERREAPELPQPPHGPYPR